MSVRVVPIEDVIERLPDRVPAPYQIRTMQRVLERQGQIEPLVLTFEDYWSVPIVYAAVELDWPTLLVTERNITSG